MQDSEGPTDERDVDFEAELESTVATVYLQVNICMLVGLLFMSDDQEVNQRLLRHLPDCHTLIITAINIQLARYVDFTDVIHEQSTQSSDGSEASSSQRKRLDVIQKMPNEQLLQMVLTREQWLERSFWALSNLCASPPFKNGENPILDKFV